MSIQTAHYPTNAMMFDLVVQQLRWPWRCLKVIGEWVADYLSLLVSV